MHVARQTNASALGKQTTTLRGTLNPWVFLVWGRKGVMHVLCKMGGGGKRTREEEELQYRSLSLSLFFPPLLFGVRKQRYCCLDSGTLGKGTSYLPTMGLLYCGCACKALPRGNYCVIAAKRGSHRREASVVFLLLAGHPPLFILRARKSPQRQRQPQRRCRQRSRRRRRLARPGPDGPG